MLSEARAECVVPLEKHSPIISVSPENGFALFTPNTGTVAWPLGTCKRQGATKCSGVSCRPPYNRLARVLLDLNSSPENKHNLDRVVIQRTNLNF